MLSVKNRAEGVLNANIDNAVTELVLTTGGGSNFPTANFHITIEDEILLCTSRTADTLTVVRGKEDTTPAAHTAGKSVELRITAGVIQDIHYPTGKVYTPATGAQTVTIDCAANKIHIVNGHASGTAITFAITGATNNQPFIISILQGAVVSTIVAWFATVRWAGGSAPTLTATVAKRDTFGFIRTGANTYDGYVIGQNC